MENERAPKADVQYEWRSICAFTYHIVIYVDFSSSLILIWLMTHIEISRLEYSQYKLNIMRQEQGHQEIWFQGMFIVVGKCCLWERERENRITTKMFSRTNYRAFVRYCLFGPVVLLLCLSDSGRTSAWERTLLESGWKCPHIECDTIACIYACLHCSNHRMERKGRKQNMFILQCNMTGRFHFAKLFTWERRAFIAWASYFPFAYWRIDKREKFSEF